MATDPTAPLYSDLAIHPGEHLGEELEARSVTQRQLARDMRRPPQLVSAIINGRKSITAETALDLERVLDIDAQFWLNLQSRYDLTLARQRQARRSA